MAQGKPTPRRLSGQTLFLAAAIVLLGAVIGYVVFQGGGGVNGNAEAAANRLRLQDIPFNGTRAYEYLKQLCDIGPRPSGSQGMAQQQKLLTEHFRKLGGKVELQSFQTRHPVDGSPVAMANLIVRWHPDRKQRVLLAAHYDTRPFPSLDPENPRGVFVGANDGASGVAVLMELGQEMAKFESNYGVDFAFFDAEEFVFKDDDPSRVQKGDPYFLGAEYFAQAYAKKHAGYRYRWGVLLDMVGDADLQIYQEAYSVSWRDTKPLVDQIWATAARLGVREFIPRRKHLIRDDHLALRNTAKIPTCDIIDFDYPAWHTQGDTPDKCSALSLAKVGWVVNEWLKGLGAE